MTFGTNRGELRDDGIRLGLALLALLTLDVDGSDEALDLVGRRDRQHEAAIAVTLGVRPLPVP